MYSVHKNEHIWGVNHVHCWEIVSIRGILFLGGGWGVRISTGGYELTTDCNRKRKGNFPSISPPTRYIVHVHFTLNNDTLLDTYLSFLISSFLYSSNLVSSSSFCLLNSAISFFK